MSPESVNSHLSAKNETEKLYSLHHGLIEFRFLKLQSSSLNLFSNDFKMSILFTDNYIF